MSCVPIALKVFRGIGVLLVMLAIIHPMAACGDKATIHDSTIPSDDQVIRGGAGPSVPQPSVAVSDQNIPVYTYDVINSWPHDPDAFTQGLVFHDGKLYESTGHYGSSTLRKLELKKGEILKKVAVAPQCFAEGITIYQGKIYQLTWEEHKAFVYDLKSFRLESEIAYEGEGWGLTHDEHHLIMSDGTNEIRFVDPVTFKTTRTISVMENGEPLLELNELEYIKGEIYANVWKSDRIARIDPHDGKLLGWIDLTGLHPLVDRSNSENVLNGIAYDEKDDRLLVTGKRWPKIFEIRLKAKTSP
jgi:glutamine cyclotransferase